MKSNIIKVAAIAAVLTLSGCGAVDSLNELANGAVDPGGTTNTGGGSGGGGSGDFSTPRLYVNAVTYPTGLYDLYRFTGGSNGAKEYNDVVVAGLTNTGNRPIRSTTAPVTIPIDASGYGTTEKMKILNTMVRLSSERVTPTSLRTSTSDMVLVDPRRVDINGDGLDDVVAAVKSQNGETHPPQVWLQTKVTTATGDRYVLVNINDLNESVMLPSVQLPEFNAVKNIMIRDFNRDGRDDALFVTGGVGKYENDTFLISDPDGEGYYAQEQHYLSPNPTNTIAVKYANQSNHMVVILQEQLDDAPSIHVGYELSGAYDSCDTCYVPTTITVDTESGPQVVQSASAKDLVITDTNNDGIEDLVLLGVGDGRVVSILASNPGVYDGTVVQSDIQLDVVPANQSVAYDYDTEGDIDIAVPVYTATGTTQVKVITGIENGLFADLNTVDHPNGTVTASEYQNTLYNATQNTTSGSILPNVNVSTVENFSVRVDLIDPTASNNKKELVEYYGDNVAGWVTVHTYAHYSLWYDPSFAYSMDDVDRYYSVSYVNPYVPTNATNTIAIDLGNNGTLDVAVLGNMTYHAYANSTTEQLLKTAMSIELD